MHIKALLLAIACTAAFGVAAPPAHAWELALPLAQAPGQKGGPPPGGFNRGGGGGGGAGGGGGREVRPERPADPRGGRMSEDARQSLHRDLDKANRELYGRGQPQK